MKPVFAPLMNMLRICMAGMMAVVAVNAWAAGGAPAAAGKSKLDVNGTWNAKVEGRGPPQTVVFVLRQDKEKLTGTMSTNGGLPVEIQNGKVYRSTIRFSVMTQKVTTSFLAGVDSDTMTLKVRIDGARAFPQRAQVRRTQVISNGTLPGCVSGDGCGFPISNDGAILGGGEMMVTGGVQVGPVPGYQAGGTVGGMPIADIRKITATR